jgi:hypothetical protein
MAHAMAEALAFIIEPIAPNCDKLERIKYIALPLGKTAADLKDEEDLGDSVNIGGGEDSEGERDDDGEDGDSMSLIC